MKVIILCIFASNNKISDMPIIDFIRKKTVSRVATNTILMLRRKDNRSPLHLRRTQRRHIPDIQQRQPLP